MLSFSTAFTHVSKNKASTSSKKLKKKHQSINRKIEAFLHSDDISPFSNMIVLKALTEKVLRSREATAEEKLPQRWEGADDTEEGGGSLLLAVEEGGGPSTEAAEEGGDGGHRGGREAVDRGRRGGRGRRAQRREGAVNRGRRGGKGVEKEGGSSRKESME